MFRSKDMEGTEERNEKKYDFIPWIVQRRSCLSKVYYPIV